ncbi:hypothetical protein [Piscinibacter koreensis]|uniref:Uncharacterized protein n=1 Tax=Piscinibacter koreensis TaxID=2742824 RepID=A0A7Y6NRQ2_9BURK|nr:hypothetical protein [Schlegelella koreensis]NUZ08083.1 hypothetical protein [Schlegelella koreensis]
MNEPTDLPPSTHSLSADITPKLPPGRANRKTLAFTAEIHRLRAAGYSFEAIRLAFLGAGFEVSRTTLKREAARTSPGAPAQREHALASRSSSPATRAAPVLVADQPLSPTSYLSDPRSGKEIAEAFMKRHIGNPLLEGKDTR